MFPCDETSRRGSASLKTSLLLAALVAGPAFQILEALSKNAAIDFYQYWAVPKALTLPDFGSPSPYTERKKYADALNRYAAQSYDEGLREVSRFRSQFHFTGTPLFYAAFVVFPTHYSTAVRVFRATEVLLFVMAILVCGWLHRVGPSESLLFASVLLATYQPFRSDYQVGNVNTFQLFVCVLLTAYAERLLDRRNGPGRLAARTLFLSALGALTLFKPNLAVVALLLGMHVLVRHGMRLSPQAITLAAACSLVLLVLPCPSFGSWTIWQEWFGTVYGGGGHGTMAALAASPTLGNYAALGMVSSRLGVGVFAAQAVMGVALGLPALGALALATRQSPARTQAIWRGMILALRDPHMVMAAGVIALFASSPLVWLHYYTLVLLPGLWLLWGRHEWVGARALGALSILLASGVLSVVSAVFRQPEVRALMFVSSWVPVWIGVVAAAARQSWEAVKIESPSVGASPCRVRRAEPVNESESRGTAPPCL